MGYANIAHRAMVPAILNLPNQFELAAIASRNPSKTNELAQLYGCNIFTKYEDILSSKYLDAIYVPLPNSMHYEWVKKALVNGIHVLVEKSLACRLSEVEELNNLALTNNCVLIENFQFRFHSQLRFVKDLIAAGKIGRLRCIKSSFGFPPFSDKDNIRYRRDLGGGALLDAGAYPLKLAQELLGSDLKVKSAVLNYDGNEVDIWGGGLLEQNNGNLFFQFAFGFDNFYQCSLELWGSKGKLFTNRIFTAHPKHKPELILETNEGTDHIVLEEDNHFENMLEHFFLCTQNRNKTTEEYSQNIIQSKLINQFKAIAHEK